jgi:hypothetical protein
VVWCSKLSKLLNQENALSVPCLKALSQLRGPIKVPRRGFPWEKTTKSLSLPRFPAAQHWFGLHLSRSCARGDFCSPQAPGGRRNAADRRDPSLLCHISFCYTQVIKPTSADAFQVVGGGCTGRARRCKARQGRHGKTALTCGYLPPQ